MEEKLLRSLNAKSRKDVFNGILFSRRPIVIKRNKAIVQVVAFKDNVVYGVYIRSVAELNEYFKDPVKFVLKALSSIIRSEWKSGNTANYYALMARYIILKRLAKRKVFLARERVEEVMLNWIAEEVISEASRRAFEYKYNSSSDYVAEVLGSLGEEDEDQDKHVLEVELDLYNTAMELLLEEEHYFKEYLESFVRRLKSLNYITDEEAKLALKQGLRKAYESLSETISLLNSYMRQF